VLPEAGPEPEPEEDEAAAAAAEVDAKEEFALGGCGSGVMLVRSVSQESAPGGLGLRSLSPRPSNWA
jgi:hypothetical protein